MSTTSSSSSSSGVLAWISLALAVLSGSAIGPIFKYMENGNIPPCLAACWRGQTMFISLLPLIAIEYYFDTNPKSMYARWIDYRPGCKYRPYVYVMFAGMAWSGNLLFWIVALRFTSTVKASIFASCHPLMLVVYLRCCGKHVSYMEWVGVLLVIFGLSLAILIPNSASIGESGHSSNNNDSLQSNFTVATTFNAASLGTSTMATALHTHDFTMWWSYLLNSGWYDEIIGDSLCLLSAASQCVVIMTRIKIGEDIPLFQYTITTSVVVTTIAGIRALLFESVPVFDSVSNEMHMMSVDIWCQQDWCISGWTNPRWALMILAFGFIIGSVCIAGFNYAMQHVPPLIFSSVTLLDPAVTGLLSWLGGVEGVPPLGVILGGFVVTSGIGLLTVGDSGHGPHHVPHVDDVGLDDAWTASNTSAQSETNLLTSKSPTLLDSTEEEDFEMVSRHKPASVTDDIGDSSMRNKTMVEPMPLVALWNRSLGYKETMTSYIQLTTVDTDIPTDNV